MTALIKNFGCKLCGLEKYRKNIVNGYGPLDANILVIGEGPGLKEDETGRPFVGPAGSLLRKLMQRAGLDYRQVFFTNIVRCLPKNLSGKKLVREPSKVESEACSPFLEEEIEAIKPNVIIPAGNIALRYITNSKIANITSHRGLEFWSDKYGCKIMPVIHPAAILRNPKFEGVTVEDLRRISLSAATKELTTQHLGDYTIVTTKDQLEELFRHLETEPEYSVDLETTDLSWFKGEIISMGFSWKTRTGWTLPLLKSKDPDKPDEPITRFWDDATHLYILKRLGKILALSAKKIFHNGKFDLKHLLFHKFPVANFHFDTMTAHHLLDENAENLHGLKDCAWVYTDMGGYDKEVGEYFKEHRKLKRQYIFLPFNILTKYNAADADCTFRLYKVFEPMLHQQGLNRLYKQVVMKMAQVLLEAEIAGVQVDIDYIEKLRDDYTTKKEQVEKDIHKIAGPFTITSSKQLRKVLFEDLKFKSVQKTAKGQDSTDKSSLEMLVKIYPDKPILKLLLEHRKCTKILSTFIKGLVKYLDSNNRVHSTYKQHATVTGRLASSEPNMQQIPRDVAIRGIFISKPGHTLVEADYGQAEFRWWAQLSQDPTMIADIKAGRDIHKMTAASSFGVPLDQVTKKQRQDAKAVVFGLMYGRGTYSLSQQLEMPVQEAEGVVRIFFGRYPLAKQWLRDQVNLARKYSYIVNHFGRIRRLPGINSPNEMVRAESERQVKNSPIQSGASDMTCVAAIRIRQKFLDQNLHGQLVITVHDSLAYEVPDAEVPESFKIIKSEMERPIAGVTVSMMAEMKIGTRWGHLTELNDAQIDNLIPHYKYGRETAICA